MTVKKYVDVVGMRFILARRSGLEAKIIVAWSVSVVTKSIGLLPMFSCNFVPVRYVVQVRED